jgi:hypothetical protein
VVFAVPTIGICRAEQREKACKKLNVDTRLLPRCDNESLSKASAHAITMQRSLTSAASAAALVAPEQRRAGAVGGAACGVERVPGLVPGTPMWVGGGSMTGAWPLAGPRPAAAAGHAGAPSQEHAMAGTGFAAQQGVTLGPAAVQTGWPAGYGNGSAPMAAMSGATAPGAYGAAAMAGAPDALAMMGLSRKRDQMQMGAGGAARVLPGRCPCRVSAQRAGGLYALPGADASAPGPVRAAQKDDEARRVMPAPFASDPAPSLPFALTSSDMDMLISQPQPSPHSRLAMRDFIVDTYDATGLHRKLTHMDMSALLSQAGFPCDSHREHDAIVPHQWHEFCEQFKNVIATLQQVRRRRSSVVRVPAFCAAWCAASPYGASRGHRASRAAA